MTDSISLVWLTMLKAFERSMAIFTVRSGVGEKYNMVFEENGRTNNAFKTLPGLHLLVANMHSLNSNGSFPIKTQDKSFPALIVKAETDFYKWRQLNFFFKIEHMYEKNAILLFRFLTI